MHKKTFIDLLFAFLRDKRYCWLKALNTQPADTAPGSDIDLLIRREDLPSILAFARQAPQVSRCRAVHRASVTYLELYFTDGDYLQVDLLTALVRKDLEYLPADYVRANCQWQNGVATYTPVLLLEHVLLFNFLNGSGLPAKYIRHFEGFPTAIQQHLLGFLADKYGISVQAFRQLADFDAVVRNALLRYLAARPENCFPRRLRNGLRYLSDRLSTAREGRVITFSGVDGAGKTTILNALHTELTEKFRRRVVVLRHRPSLLPILSAYRYGRAGAEARAAGSLPRQGVNQNRGASLLRFAYYLFDYLVGQMYVRLRFLARGYVVLYDRYYFDFIADPRRSNLRLGAALPKSLYRLIAKPDLNIFLYAEPELILQRKKELPAADIRQLTVRYKGLFREFEGRFAGQYRCLENKDKAETLHTIVQHYLQTL